MSSTASSYGLCGALFALAMPAIAADFTQSQLDALASSLDVQYEVKSNLASDICERSEGPCSLAQITLQNPGDTDFRQWELFFSQTSPIKWDGSEHFDITHINGDLHRITPTDKFKGFKAGKDYEIPISGAFTFVAESDVMPNYYLIADGLEPRVIKSTEEQKDPDSGIVSVTHAKPFVREEQLKRSGGDKSAQADAAYLFDYYAELEVEETPDTRTRIIPAIRTVDANGESLDVSGGLKLSVDELTEEAAALMRLRGLHVGTAGVPVTYTKDEQLGDEAYELHIDSDAIAISSSTQTGYFYALVSVAWLFDQAENTLPVGHYQDNPRFSFRGLHLDVSRNFHSKEMVLTLIEQMANLKLNKLHLHLADDEGWRLEIPDLPELTQIGAFRCHDLKEEKCLLPQLGSGPHRDTSVNGYYSVSDYKEILQAARLHHVEVIPSLDMPGHSRAAIKAMLARHNKFIQQEQPEKAKEYLLTDLEDTTEYRSIQNYNDNTINPCIDSSYRFIDKVLREIKDMHEEAGAPLLRYHIGADETAGAWKESPACKALMKKHNIDDTEQLTAYFVSKVAKMVNEMDVMAAAWSDGLSHVERESLAPRIQANIWDLLPSQGHNNAHKFANEGWDTVLSLPDVLYFDFPYYADPKEPGYYWGSRSTDSFEVFQFMPDNLPAHAEFWESTQGTNWEAKDTTPLNPDASFTGIQGQLWSETVRHDTQAEYMLYPRLIAMAERAWHTAKWEVPYKAGRSYGPDSDHFNQDAQQTQKSDWAEFVSVMTEKVLPVMDKQDAFFRVPQPGAKVEDGKLQVNTLWPDLKVEYRTDGGDWKEYSQPVKVQNSVELRTRLPAMERTSRVVQVEQPE